jgi:hypothetical protein
MTFFGVSVHLVPLDFNITFPGDWSLEVVRLLADDLRGAAEVVLRIDVTS